MFRFCWRISGSHTEIQVMIDSPRIDDGAMTTLHARDAVTDAVLFFEGYRESEMNTVQLIAAGRSDTGYKDPENDDYNTDFSSAADARASREQHEKGVFGEAAVAKHHSDDYTIHSLDDELTRCGDGGVDLKIDGTAVDVKTTDFGYERGRVPLQNVNRTPIKRTLSASRTATWTR